MVNPAGLKKDIAALHNSGRFDEAWYLRQYPDVALSGLSPAEHFIRIGRQLGRRSYDDVHVASPANGAPVKSEKGYAGYAAEIFAGIERIGARPPLPVEVEIDIEYAGPPFGGPFDGFLGERHREESRKQLRRMLERGVVAVNPSPGVHAARNRDGDFIRYRSIAAGEIGVSRLPETMLVHIHAFYVDVLAEILAYFAKDARQGRFLITTTTAASREEIQELVETLGFARCEVMLIENRGRDIGPFLDHAIDYSGLGDILCHVHTKKTPYFGEEFALKWRKSLYGALLTQSAIDAFDDPQLGLLFPENPHAWGWGKNRAICEKIACHFGAALSAHPGPMPIGNMFYVHTDVARAMRDACKNFEWPKEPVPYDGTVLHAIERMWTQACDFAELDWAAIYTARG